MVGHQPQIAAAALLCWLLAVAGPACAEETSWLLYRNDQDGFELRYPPGFVAGTYKSSLPPDLASTPREGGSQVPFENAVVLVERARVGTRDLWALPVGEVTAITIELQSGRAAATRRDLGRQIYGAAIGEVTIGAHRVQKFPGFPGPYGTGAFYYLVPLRDDAALEFTAHRRFLEPPHGETGYDRVIEEIIGTLKFFPARP